jgi:GT2 family glycosyltransferase
MISVVTPTFRRPNEIRGLLENLARQQLLPEEVIIVDGAPETERETEELVRSQIPFLRFRCRYIRHARGTAIQRNAGIDLATASFVALIDDDVRLEADFFRSILDVFESDKQRKVGGVAGYRTNRHFKLTSAQRWRWYRRLRLLSTFEPGRYDFQTGYPINANMQPPFSGVREVDFMTTACAMWRREVFDSGLRFDPFFRDYGVLEDAHFALRAARDWVLLQCGDACCSELPTENGRENRRQLGHKYVVNYYYVFKDIVRPLTGLHKFRFWRFQAFEFLRIAASALRHRRVADLTELRGRLNGITEVALGTARLDS